MSYSLGLDVGSTYTKAVLLRSDRGSSENLVAHAMEPTGYRLAEVAQRVAERVARDAGIAFDEIAYTISTGYGRHMVPFRDLQVTDLTAAARGAKRLFPETRTVLDIGGQTMKACRLDEAAKVKTFRLNDKCAAGTGAFLEKTARYMGLRTEDIAPLLERSREAVSISGVCAVFAESEVISHLSQGVPPEDIMAGAIHSLTTRSLQLLKRIKSEPEYTLIGGILRWPELGRQVAERLDSDVNVPEGDLPQYIAALGAAVLGHVRLRKLAASPSELECERAERADAVAQ